MKIGKKSEMKTIEDCLKEMAFIGMAMDKSENNLKPAYFFNIFDIKRELPNFVGYVNENYLKKLSKKFKGPLIFVGGTTEFEIPAFLRKKPHFIDEEELFLRFLYPSEFKTYEIFVDSNKIEARIFYKKRQGNNYFCYEHYLRANGIEEITVYPIKNILEQTI